MPVISYSGKPIIASELIKQHLASLFYQSAARLAPINQVEPILSAGFGVFLYLLIREQVVDEAPSVASSDLTNNSDQHFGDPIPDETPQRPPELGIQLAESIHKYRMEHNELR